eukprot:7245515-Pyramimonas_sp.AAC.1
MPLPSEDTDGPCTSELGQGRQVEEERSNPGAFPPGRPEPAVLDHLGRNLPALEQGQHRRQLPRVAQRG